MRELLRRGFRQNLFLIASLLAMGASCAAQQPEGPQSDAPPPVAPKPAQEQPPGSSEKITVPAGTRVGVVLQNGISTHSAKAGDSVYLQTSFPITASNRIVIPVGSPTFAANCWKLSAPGVSKVVASFGCASIP